MQINTSTSLYCIFGSPVKHSFSPYLHNEAFRVKNINAVYLAFEPESIPDAINAVRTLDIQGASITIPYKIDVITYLDEIDPLARDIGSVNTLLNRGGKIKGYNTDGTGAVTAIKKGGISVNKGNFLILGNGGSARAIAFTLLSHGSNVTIAGRNIKKVKELLSSLQEKYPETSGTTIGEMTPEITSGFTVIINTTPVGMEPDTDSSPFPKALMHKHVAFFDIVYRPDMTLFLKNAEAHGCRIIKGIEMLFYQGIEQFKIWTGLPAPEKEMRDILMKAVYS